MFESLSKRISTAIDSIRGKGRITEDNIEEVITEIKVALLYADVNFHIVKEVCNRMKDKAIGQEVHKSIKPADMFIKIVNDELVKLLGFDKSELSMKKDLNTIMLVGLQGSGKTTMCSKLAYYLRKKHHRKVLLIAGDVYRPAAIDQLEQLAKNLNIDIYIERDNKNVLEIVQNGLKYAKEKGLDYVIIDTAGRTQLDDDLMNELVNIENNIKLDETLLVLDAMMGQDGINVINGFKDKVNLSGVVITKLDGDTRVGIALSARYVTNVAIKFVGTSERFDGLDTFDPKRIAGRILGMGDIVSLVEKASDVINEKEAEKDAKKIMKGDIDLEDFLKQIKMIRKLGGLQSVLKMLPNTGALGAINVSEKDISHMEAIVLSMTPEERANPSIIKSERKARISKGSARSREEINQLLKQFEMSKQMLKMMKGAKGFKFPF